jgi:peptide/nickel transport system substrate-binding protein
VSMKKAGKNLVVLLVLGLSVLLVADRSGAGAADAPKNKDSLIVAMGSDAKSFDPQGSRDIFSNQVNRQVYNMLLVLNEEKNEIVPGLAESYKKIDDLTYEFKLKKGVKFHNGELFKASDVKFTLERALSPAGAPIGSLVGNLDIDGLKTPDDSTVIIKLKKPNPGFLTILTMENMGMLNEKAVKAAGKDYGQNPVGTGPYKFVSWQRGNKIEMTRFDEHFGDKPKIKNIVIRIIPEGTNRVIELESGGVDITYDVTTNDVKLVQENKNLQLFRTIDNSVTFMGFNTSKKPFNDIRVRQAFAYAIDINAVVEGAWRGVGKPATGMIAPNLMYANPALKTHEYNPAKAKQLLAEAGYPNGFKAESWTNDRKERIDMAQIMQSMLKEVGIEIEIKVFEWGAYFDKTGKGEHSMYQMSWTVSANDPDQILDPLFHSKNVGAAGNRAYYSNAKLDELISKGSTMDNGEAKKKVYFEIQDILMTELPYMPLLNGEQVIGVRKNIKGFKPSPSAVHNLFTVSFE